MLYTGRFRLVGCHANTTRRNRKAERKTQTKPPVEPALTSHVAPGASPSGGAPGQELSAPRALRQPLHHPPPAPQRPCPGGSARLGVPRHSACVDTLQKRHRKTPRAWTFRTQNTDLDLQREKEAGPAALCLGNTILLAFLYCNGDLLDPLFKPFLA